MSPVRTFVKGRVLFRVTKGWDFICTEGDDGGPANESPVQDPGQHSRRLNVHHQDRDSQRPFDSTAIFLHGTMGLNFIPLHIK